MLEKYKTPGDSVFMPANHLAFLNLSRHAGRYSRGPTSIILGVREHDIPILYKANHLKALGHPSEGSVKYFSSAYAFACAEDARWLSKATDILYSHWKS